MLIVSCLPSGIAFRPKCRLLQCVICILCRSRTSQKMEKDVGFIFMLDPRLPHDTQFITFHSLPPIMVHEGGLMRCALGKRHEPFAMKREGKRRKAREGTYLGKVQGIFG